MKSFTKLMVFLVIGSFLVAANGPEIMTSSRVNIPSSQIVSGQESNIGIDILSEDVVSGVQFTIHYDADKIQLFDAVMNQQNANFDVYSKINDGRMAVIAFSMTGEKLELGDGAEINIPAKAIGNFLGDVEFVMSELILATSNATALNADISVGDVSVTLDIPTTYGIDQNYPNPFNPTTTINYQLPVESAVALVIYNLRGQIVTTLVNDTKEAGYYSVVWDGTNDQGKMVASGEYIYSIKAGEFTKNMKMIFLK